MSAEKTFGYITLDIVIVQVILIMIRWLDLSSASWYAVWLPMIMYGVFMAAVTLVCLFAGKLK